jgi:hypothetical protein
MKPRASMPATLSIFDAGPGLHHLVDRAAEGRAHCRAAW